MSKTAEDHYTSPERAREVAIENLRPDDSAQHRSDWDKFIRLMQIFLPIAAIVLGTVTASWPFLNETEVSFTLSQDDVTRSDGVIRMTNLNYVGTDARDRLFRIHASNGEQDDPNAPRVRLSNIDAEMELGEGNTATVVARTGIYRTKNNSLSLVGGVNLETGNGYQLEMAGAEINLKARSATGQGAIKGQSELGMLTAAKMSLSVREKEAVFDGGVNVHIVPRRPAEKSDAS